jgi:glucose/arabinose dehydrogenase
MIRERSLRRVALAWAVLVLPGLLSGAKGVLATPPGPLGGMPPVALGLQVVTEAIGDAVDVTHASRNDTRLFIVEQQGRIRVFKAGRLLNTPFLDIRPKVATDDSERGLLSLAFHPDYPAKPYFYVYYTNQEAAVGGHGAVVIARYQVSSNPDVADPASARVLLVIDHPAGNHNGGKLAFGPDRKMYASIGDGGGGCDHTGPGCNAQRDNRLLGKLLRFDIEQNENQTPFYGVPADNPFLGLQAPFNLIWAKGLRNPFRISFDRQTGDLWIGDVGQTTREEIDFQPASSNGGENYGWPHVEGTECHTCGNPRNDCPVPNLACNAAGLTGPVHEYGRGDGNVVIGGVVYRGGGIPTLRGYYLFGDSGSGRLWGLRPGNRARVEFRDDVGGLSSFGEDREGEVYVCILGSGVYRLIEDRPPQPAPSERPPLTAAAALLALAALLACRNLRRRIASRCSALVLLLSGCLLLPSVAQSQLCSGVSIMRLLLPNSTATSAPVEIRNAGDERLFIVEQNGRILIYKNGALLGTPFLNLMSKVAFGGERGLLSLAFHPQYPIKPYFFVYYTNEDTNTANFGDVIVARYNVSPNPDLADPNTENILLIIPHSIADNHNGGQLQFSPNDGYLYITIGDGGGGCDSVSPGCNAQRDNLLLGKALRIDVDQNENVPPFYGIPLGNPFADPNNPRPGDVNDPQRDEIWAKGLRNPFRFSFDRQTGGMWIGDVGQSSREEVDFQAAGSAGGRNYGWKFMEGALCDTCSLTNCTGVTIIPCNDAALTLPVHDYARNVGSTIIGGYVYRGSLISNLNGCYVFGDFGFGEVWALNAASPGTRFALLSGQSGLTTFGEDRNGELYAAVSGDVYRLLPPGPTLTPTLTLTPDPGITSTPTWTPLNTRTRTGTRTGTPTRTPTATRTPTQTQTATSTRTATSTATITRTSTPTATITDTPTITATPTVTATPTQTNTFPPGFTPPSETPTETPMDTATPTETPPATSTATPTDTAPEATSTPTATARSMPSGSGGATAALACLVLLAAGLLGSALRRVRGSRPPRRHR